MVHFHNLKLYHSQAAVTFLSYFTGDNFMHTCLNTRVLLQQALMLVRVEVNAILVLVSIQ